MGVKGLSSYLKNEPSRFGRRVSLKDRSGIIFIDGPAFHYYLIHSICKKSLPPSSETMVDLDDSPVGIVSPRAIFNLSSEFFLYLFSIIDEQCEVHLVFDGIASSYKENNQILRIQESCNLYDETVRAFIRNEQVKRPIVSHLFGEDAIANAIQNIKEPRLKIFHAQGEAETFIYTATQDLIDMDVLVLSSDSDFLLFPGIPGYVPWQSMEYTADGIDGWEYTRTQFLAAHPDLSDSNASMEFRGMICIAAFCGCDYTLEPRLQKRLKSAQTIILKSNIGGLKSKDRFKPSFKNIALSVLRYVAYFKKKFKMDWYHEMMSAIVNAESSKISLECRLEDLHEALEQIYIVYKGDEEGNGRPKEVSSELRRIISLQKLYCKPVLELYKIDKDANIKSDTEEHQSNGVKMRSNQGVWMDPRFSSCRDRIYSLLSTKYPKLRDSIITEFTRSGGYGQVSLRVIEKSTSVRDNNFDFHHTAQLLCSLCVPSTDDTIVLCSNYLHQLPSYLHGAFLASMMLEQERHVLFLYLLILIFPKDHNISTSIDPPRDRCEYIKALGKCNLAIFHIKLAKEAILCIDNSSRLDNVEFQYCDIFSDRKAAIIWNVIEEYENNFNYHIENISESLHQSKHIHPVNNVDDIRLLWDAWSKTNL